MEIADRRVGLAIYKVQVSVGTGVTTQGTRQRTLNKFPMPRSAAEYVETIKSIEFVDEINLWNHGNSWFNE